MSNQDLIKVTITMTKDERRALKQLALDRDTTVSALIRGWLADCEREVEKERLNS